MKKLMKAVVLTIFTTAILFLGAGKVYAITQNEVQSKLYSLTNQYVGTYWTKNGQPSSNYQNSNYWYGWQCKGFANFIFKEIFGVNHIGPYPEGIYYYLSPVNGATELGRLSSGSMSVENAKNLLSKGAPGDYIQVKRRGRNTAHSMILYSTSSSGIKVFDCNSDGKCGVRLYDISWQSFYNSNDSMSLYRANGYTPSSGHNPEGAWDVITGHDNSFYIRGWAFDRDNVSASLSLHVYVGGPAGSGAPGYVITANTVRDDVAAQYPGVGNRHGFDSTILTEKTGNQTVYIYMINEGEGSNILLGTKTVNIGKDTEPPKVSKTWVDSVDGGGYTVKIQFTENVGLKEATCATWTLADEQDDMKWSAVNIKGNEGSVYIKFSDHGNQIGDYASHIYLYDFGGNSGFGAAEYCRWEDLGDEFYAHIQSTETGGYMANYATNTESVAGMGAAAKDANTLWKFKKQSDRSYQILSCQDGKALDVDAASSNAGAKVQMWDPNNSTAQSWYFCKNGSGFNLMPLCAKGKAVTTSMVTADITAGTASQIFKIVKVTDTTDYLPKLFDLETYSDQACKTETDHFQPGDTLYMKPEYRNVPYYTFTVIKDGKTIQEEEIVGTQTVLAVHDLTEGDYTIRLSASNFLGDAKEELIITVGEKKPSVTPEPDDPEQPETEQGIVKAGSVSGAPGETVKVPITIEKNPGVVAVQFKLGYDATKVKLTKVEDTGLFDAPVMAEKYEVNPYILSWGEGILKEDITDTGTAAFAYFEILDGAKNGTAEITVAYDQAYNTNLEEVIFAGQNGSITITSGIPGDVNGDGTVKLNDAILLRRYIAGGGGTIDMEAADVNGDGSVKLNDAIILRRYIAGWDVTLR